jgi:hypothetical protein
MTLPLSADENSALSKLMTILKPLRDFADGLELTLTLPLIDTLLLAASHPDKVSTTLRGWPASGRAL